MLFGAANAGEEGANAIWIGEARRAYEDSRREFERAKTVREVVVVRKGEMVGREPNVEEGEAANGDAAAREEEAAGGEKGGKRR